MIKSTNPFRYFDVSPEAFWLVVKMNETSPFALRNVLYLTG